MVNRNIHLFLIPMTFCTFFLLDFCPFLSPPACLLSEIFIQAPLSIVSFCVRDVFNFQLTDGEELLAILYSYDLVLCSDIHFFLGSFDSSQPFGFQFLAWDHLYIIYCLPCFLSMGLLLSPPREVLSVRWMEPQNSILDLLILSYFTGIKQDFNVFIAIQENCQTRRNPFR